MLFRVAAAMGVSPDQLYIPNGSPRSLAAKQGDVVFRQASLGEHPQRLDTAVPSDASLDRQRRLLELLTVDASRLAELGAP